MTDYTAAMAEGETADAIAPARHGNRRRLAAVIAAAILAALLLLWVVRRPIAQHFVDRELARRGVPARYVVADLGFGRQRLTDVSIGDPAHPDLIADWIETDTAVGLTGARLVGVRAGHVRLRGRMAGGRLSLGSLDRLLPASNGQRAGLPAIDLDIADARATIGTPVALFGLRLSGRGWLDGGFRGRLSLADLPGERSAGLTLGSCRLDGVAGEVAVAIGAAGVRLNGPVRAGGVDCGTLRFAPRPAAIDVTVGTALDRWAGRVSAGSLVDMVEPHASATLAGAATFSGTPAGTNGTVTLAGPAAWEGHGRADRLSVTGEFQAGPVYAFQGRARLTGAGIQPSLSSRVVNWSGSADDTPVGPLARKAAGAIQAAGRRFDADADLLVQHAQGVSTASIERVSFAAASGARADFTGRPGIGWRSVDGGWTADGRVAVAGGGLPTGRARLRRDGAGRLSGAATLAPYAAGGARLALTPVTFRAGAGAASVNTTVTVSGPIADGRVEDVRVPIAVRRTSGGGWVVGGGCTPVAWRHVAMGGLALDPARVVLCPTGTSLIATHDGRIAGGASLGATHLTGRVGASALDLTIGRASVAWPQRALVVSDVAVRLGDPARPVRIATAKLSARMEAHRIAGGFEGAGGQIGAVPLLLSGAAGDWRFEDGRLSMAAASTVADTAASPRFQPLDARDITFTFAGDAIHATGTLVEPATGTRVATVAIDHALGAGRGEAVLRVAGIDFTPAFQPDRLTRLTYGVIADVRGTVNGNAHIGWGPDGVTSTGTFRTAGTDLAAAFGPVTGLATEIHFTDLLSLASAPGQVATVASINPGIPVENGVVRYRTLPDNRVRVEGARWPFAGGTLTLEPTLLDFGTDTTRHMTFGVEGVAADRFLQQFDFKNLDATGVFDGTLPMTFDAAGGRIEDGRLTVRPGGGGIAYVGEISRRDVGFWANLAFGALRSLRYRDLAITMNGPLAGEMVTDVRFSGVSQGQGATSNFLIRRLQKLPFVFNVRIAAPFRGLIDSAQSFYDPKRLIDRNLPALLDAQNRRIQPPASEKSP